MVTDIRAATHAQELRELWQSRVLQHTKKTPLGMVVLSVIAHAYDEGDALLTLMQATFPGFKSIAAPFCGTAGKVVKTGAVCADVVMRDGTIEKNVVFFTSTAHMRDVFRKLADELALTDPDRREMFAAAQRWVVLDYRLDPTMNPQDPEARRLVVH